MSNRFGHDLQYNFVWCVYEVIEALVTQNEDTKAAKYEMDNDNGMVY